MDYVNRYERELINNLETLFTKYETTLTTILEERDQAAEQLGSYLTQLGYA